jgi:uncharacterized protein
MRHSPTRAIAGAFVIVLAACASPSSRFYTLSAASKSAPAGPASHLSVAVGPVSIPAAVDRPEIVVSTGPNQVRLEEYDRWASPLQDDIARVVAANLVSMLGTPHVTQFPKSLAGAAAYRASIEVQQFESVPGETAALDAVWTVRRPADDKSRSGRTTVRESVQQTGYDALAAAHSRAIARLSQDIADAVRALAGAAG